MVRRTDHETTSDNKGPANDNSKTNDNNLGGTAEPEANTSVAAAAKSSTAMTSLQALGDIVNNIDTSGSGGASKPLLSFKSREHSWQIGRQRNVVEDGSNWLVNVLSAEHGYVYFDNDNKPTSKMVPAHKPMPDRTELPDVGFDWNDQRSFELKCLDGQDQGAEVEFRTTSYGGIAAFNELFDAVKARFNGGQHEGKLFPKVQLEQTSYPHPSYGKIANPVFVITGWSTIDGPSPDGGQPMPQPAPASPPPPKSPPAVTATTPEQPRRRRVA
jgi:hypothetical protein